MNIAELRRLEAEAQRVADELRKDWLNGRIIHRHHVIYAEEVVSRIVAMRNALPEMLKAEAHDALVEALTPSAGTKAAYMGEFSFPFPIFNPDGEEMPFTPNVPWTTIKEIMKAIADRAALAKLGGSDVG